MTGLRARVATRWAALPRPAGAASLAAVWRAWGRLDELEAIEEWQRERQETMAQIDDLQAAVTRLATINRQLVASLAAARDHSASLAAQLAAGLDAAAVQAVIDQANAAAIEAEAALAPPAVLG